MKKFNFKKRFITLVEMMIVMFLIAMITGVIAYNYTGSLEQGKVFKTEAGMDKIRTILDLHLATTPEDSAKIQTEWQDFVRKSPLVKNADDMMKDGWGVYYEVTTNNNGDIQVTSRKYETYRASKGQAGSVSRQ